jgi:undecaprenyl diphosphate synthase
VRKDELLAAGIRVRVRGDLTRLPFAARAALRALERASAGNTRLTLVLAINYGGRDEILRAVRSIARDGVAHDAITEDLFRNHLELPDVGDPEIVIRTGGEQRLSNFLIYQCAYSEFVTLPVLWPDFTEEHLAQAMEQFSGRQRRFGA